ncbi:hypothetical protein Tsubulata_004777 [Turnera subulata]|uniref:DUF3615 domain-containing protein n=1 Tax=Turnera subulata TaxID=218843 RepID=A0A9Q0F9T5_9ROSI|nr:hypothetical protein Tsubulata_004777 [Turnera subulata]
MKGRGRAPARGRNSTKKGPKREKLRKEAIEILRNHRGGIRDPSGLLKPDDPELEGIEGIHVDRDGIVYKVTPNLGRPPILDPEEEAERKRAWFSKCRPHAIKALELYQRQNGTAFDLEDVEVVGAAFRLCMGGGVHHLKFTAKPVTVGSQAETGTAATTFFAEVHSTARRPSHASRCFTIGSLISEPDPDFEIVKNVELSLRVYTLRKLARKATSKELISPIQKQGKRPARPSKL